MKTEKEMIERIYHDLDKIFSMKPFLNEPIVFVRNNIMFLQTRVEQINGRNKQIIALYYSEFDVVSVYKKI